MSSRISLILVPYLYIEAELMKLKYFMNMWGRQDYRSKTFITAPSRIAYAPVAHDYIVTWKRFACDGFFVRGIHRLYADSAH